MVLFSKFLKETTYILFQLLDKLCISIIFIKNITLNLVEYNVCMLLISSSGAEIIQLSISSL